MNFDDLFRLTPNGSAGDSSRWIAAGAPPTDERCVFGGLVVGQAIVAASAETRKCHSLHAFFIGMGAKQQPFEITVQATRDGGSFSTRHVEICQGDRLLLAGYTSHHDGNRGPQHQSAMPDVAPPDNLEDLYIAYRRRQTQLGKPQRNYLAEQMMNVRPVLANSVGMSAPPAAKSIWFRPRAFIHGNLAVHQAAIAFASDAGLVRAGLERHADLAAGSLQTASLDHAIWFHREASANDWMLHVLDSPAANAGRGFSRAAIYSRDGTLVASVVQEFLARFPQTQQARETHNKE